MYIYSNVLTATDILKELFHVHSTDGFTRNFNGRHVVLSGYANCFFDKLGALKRLHY